MIQRTSPKQTSRFTFILFSTLLFYISLCSSTTPLLPTYPLAPLYSKTTTVPSLDVTEIANDPPNLPFTDVSFQIPTRTIQAAVWRGIFKNPYTTKQLKQLQLDVEMYTPKGTDMNPAWPQEGTIFIFDYLNPTQIKNTSDNPLKMKKPEATEKNVSRGTSSFSFYSNTEQDRPEYIAMTIHFFLRSEFFVFKNEHDHVFDLNLKVSSKVPDDDTTELSTAFSSSNHQVVLGDIPILITPKTRSLPVTWAPHTALNLKQMSSFEPFIGQYFNPLYPSLQPDLELTHFFQWSVNIAWNFYLGGGHSGKFGTFLGETYPIEITFTPTGSFSLVLNTTDSSTKDNNCDDDNFNGNNINDSFESSSTSHLTCYINGYPIDANFYSSPISDTTENYITQLSIPMDNHLWSRLFYSSPYYPTDNYSPPQSSSSSQSSSQSSSPSSSQSSSSPSSSQSPSSTTIPKINETPEFRPQARFGTFDFHCGDQLLLHIPLYERLMDGKGVSDLGAHFLDIELLTKSGQNGSLRYPIFPDTAPEAIFKGPISYAPLFPPITHTSPSLFDITIPPHLVKSPPKFIIPLAPTTISSVRPSPLEGNPRMIPIKVIGSILIDTHAYRSQNAASTLGSFSFSLNRDDKIIPFDSTQKVYVYYERIGYTDDTKIDEAAKIYETSVKWKIAIPATDYFSFPSKLGVDSTTNSFKFNNDIEQYYKMTFVMELSAPNFFNNENKDFLFTNQIQLKFFLSHQVGRAIVHNIYFPYEKWLLNVQNQLQKINPSQLLTLQQPQFQQQQLQNTPHLNQNQQIDPDYDSPYEQLRTEREYPEDNRIGSLNFTTTSWDLYTLKTNSIHLYMTHFYNNTSPTSPKLEQIDRVSIHLIGPYRFQTTGDSPINPAQERYFPYRPSIISSSQTLPIIIKCKSKSTNSTNCTPTDIVATATAISFKIKAEDTTAKRPLNFQHVEISIDSAILSIVPITTQHLSPPTDTSLITLVDSDYDVTNQDGLGDDPKNTLVSLTAHIDFVTPSSTSTPIQTIYSQSVDFPLTFQYQQNFEEVPSALGFLYKDVPDDTDDSGGDDDTDDSGGDGDDTKKPPSHTLVIVISACTISLICIGLVYCAFITILKDQKGIVMLYQGAIGDNNNNDDDDDDTDLLGRPLDHSNNNHINLIDLSQSLDQNLLLDLEQSSLLNNELLSLASGMTEQLNQYQPPTYNDFNAGDHVEDLPKYDQEMEEIIHGGNIIKGSNDDVNHNIAMFSSPNTTKMNHSDTLIIPRAVTNISTHDNETNLIGYNDDDVPVPYEMVSSGINQLQSALSPSNDNTQI